MEKEHHGRKNQALERWERLDNPSYDAPLNIEACYSEEVLNIAKRGRKCTLETAVMGRNKPKRARMDHERSAKLSGETEIEVELVREYPEALWRYRDVLFKFQARALTGSKEKTHDVRRRRK